jgi:hypothetical protein
MSGSEKIRKKETTKNEEKKEKSRAMPSTPYPKLPLIKMKDSNVIIDCPS